MPIAGGGGVIHAHISLRARRQEWKYRKLAIATARRKTRNSRVTLRFILLRLTIKLSRRRPRQRGWLLAAAPGSVFCCSLRAGLAWEKTAPVNISDKVAQSQAACAGKSYRTQRIVINMCCRNKNQCPKISGRNDPLREPSHGRQKSVGGKAKGSQCSEMNLIGEAGHRPDNNPSYTER